MHSPQTKKGERARDGGIEAEANHLAGTMLIPNEAAIYMVSHGLVSQAKIIYGVSEPILNYRLRVSGAHRIQERRLEIIRPLARVRPARSVRIA
jgi:Zn-dependent peptidase ImmA (M78 family)